MQSKPGNRSVYALSIVLLKNNFYSSIGSPFYGNAGHGYIFTWLNHLILSIQFLFFVLIDLNLFFSFSLLKLKIIINFNNFNNSKNRNSSKSMDVLLFKTTIRIENELMS